MWNLKKKTTVNIKKKKKSKVNKQLPGAKSQVVTDLKWGPSEVTG